LVFGAASGIGRAVAHRLGTGDVQLVLLSRREESLRQVAGECLGRGALLQPSAHMVDVTDADAVRRAIAWTTATHGRVDAVVYASGVNDPVRQVDRVTDATWEKILATNLTGAFHVTREVVPVMRSQHRGTIIYVASSAAKRPDQSGVAYQASKAGLAALAAGTMEECRSDGLRTSVIFPGFTNTDFQQHRPVPPDASALANALMPEDIAAACQLVLDLPQRAHVPELLVYPATQ
jgi:NADP-dependent 3-hydroxy acid dehydrogenase YdfG